MGGGVQTPPPMISVIMIRIKGMHNANLLYGGSAAIHNQSRDVSWRRGGA